MINIKTLRERYPTVPRQIFSQYIKDLGLCTEKGRMDSTIVLTDTTELTLKLEKYLWRKTKRTNSGKERLDVQRVKRILEKAKISFSEQYRVASNCNYAVDIKTDSFLIEVKHNVTYHSVGQALFYSYVSGLETLIVYGGRFDCLKTKEYAVNCKIKIINILELRKFLKGL